MSDILIKGMEMPKGHPVCIVIDPAGQARRYDLNNDKYADDDEAGWICPECKDKLKKILFPPQTDYDHL